tara:strand:- start:1906 stop:2304 length:399 start_codon:yes stop_codon:yes gene_type:complete
MSPFSRARRTSSSHERVDKKSSTTNTSGDAWTCRRPSCEYRSTGRWRSKRRAEADAEAADARTTTDDDDDDEGRRDGDVDGLRADVDGNVVGVARIVVMRAVAKWLESSRPRALLLFFCIRRELSITRSDDY